VETAGIGARPHWGQGGVMVDGRGEADVGNRERGCHGKGRKRQDDGKRGQRRREAWRFGNATSSRHGGGVGYGLRARAISGARRRPRWENVQEKRERSSPPADGGSAMVTPKRAAQKHRWAQ
jgi:hypothetical protein